MRCLCLDALSLEGHKLEELAAVNQAEVPSHCPLAIQDTLSE